MLSVVAGPIDIVAYDVGDVFLIDSSQALWMEPAPSAASRDNPALGLLVLSSYPETPHPFELYAVQLDGSALRLGARRLQETFPSIKGFGWRYDDTPCVRHNGNTWTPVRFPSTVPVGPNQETGATATMAVLADRIIWFSSGIILTGGLNDTASASECLLDGAGSGPGFLLPYDLANGKSLWWAVGADTGKVWLYDAIAKADIPAYRTSFGAAVYTAGYSRKHDLFFVTRRNTVPTPDVDQLFVYANEPVADSVSDPVFGESPLKGGITTLSAQVLGDMNEPCAGRIVQFAVDQGEVDPTAVETDATGTATTTYRAPFATATGATATATLVE